MKRLLIALTAFLLLSVASLTGCSRADVPVEKRFTSTVVPINGLGGGAYIIKDQKTGKEFLMIHIASGLAVAPL
jgi:hypothetical protein